jgi:chromosome segregation ATPase
VDVLQNCELESYVDELVQALTKAEAAGLDLNATIEHTVSTAKRKSRADRRDEACGYLERALDEVEAGIAKHREALKAAEAELPEDAEADAAHVEQSDLLDEIDGFAEQVRNAWDELTGAEFPGAFGG